MNDSRFQNRPRSFSGNGGNLPKQEVVSITYEEIGLFPRSFSRVLDRFLKQVFSDVENLVIQEYRFYRYLFLTTLKCVCLLFFVPFFINFLVKTYVVRPLAEYFWNTKQTEIFLNEYQQKHAFAELKDFEEKLYFESLIYPKSAFNRDQINIIREHNEKDELKAAPSAFISTSNIENNDKYTLDTYEYNKEYKNSSLSIPESPTKGSPFYKGAAAGDQKPDFKAQSTFVDLMDKRDNSAKLSNGFAVSPPDRISLNEQDKMTNTENRNSKMEIKNSEIPFKPDFGNPLNGDKAPGLTYKNEYNSQQWNINSDAEAVGRSVASMTRLQNDGGLYTGPQKEYDSLINSYTLKSSLFVYQTREADKNIQQRYQEQTILLAQRYNDQSIEAITHFFGDIVSLASLFYLFYALEIQINITKSFLLEVFFGLDDSKKSLLILLVTDLLVGYHSSNLWELFFSFIFHHYGLPESQTGIFLLVATLPVLLDVLFKYLIFRHLNRSSPATVATYHAMIE